MNNSRNNLRNLDRFSNISPNCDLAEGLSFEKDFFKIVVARGLGRTVVNNFLTLFRKHKIGHFPKDARSFLGLMRVVPSIEISPGRYHHFGLSQSLNNLLRYITLPHDIECIKLQINVDGLPISGSSPSSFWPILGKVVFPIQSKVFIIGLYLGEKKTIFNSTVSRFIYS